MRSKTKSATKNSPFKRLALATAACAVFLAITAGCNTSGCTDNRSSIPLAGFYSASDELPISLDSIEVGGVGAPADSLLIAINDRSNEVYLPLRSTQSSTAYFIAYRQKALDFTELIDTISMDYTSIPYFASEECGAMFRYRLTRFSYTTHLIDSIAVVPADSTFTNANIETLRLYFRTSTPPDEQ